MKVIVYTDGACSGNPGPGGWGAVLIADDHRKEISGFEPETTNNRMEMQAVISALSELKTPCEVDVYSDSSYLVDAFTKKWLDNWKRNGWKTSTKQPVLNQDLWAALLSLCDTHRVAFHKVRGHANNKENNRCDALATGAIKDNRSKNKSAASSGP
ncbi:MAG: ribonuclease HI [Oscillospiraceae bacterium]|jgi:ribonuclease HI|nr:ribonuclease HI [Oscillospiraceae bacterium]